MKLLIAIVNNDDSAVVSSALTKEGYTVTKLSTTGGFLMVGNTTFLIGADDDKVAKAKEIIKEYSQRRMHTAASTPHSAADLPRVISARRSRSAELLCLCSMSRASKNTDRGE